jgi:cation diffusion facilitator family transporter
MMAGKLPPDKRRPSKDGDPVDQDLARKEARTRQIIRVLWAILVLNLLVAIAKLLYGARSHALAITADGFHSMLDASSNVLGLLALRVARRPPDANHPYGHRKYETFAALGVAMMMLLGCREIASVAIGRLRNPVMPDVTGAGFLVLGVTMVVNVAVALAERREGRRLGSDLLVADAAHTASDVLASLLVLGSFTAARFGIHWADLVATALILVLILRAGFEVLKGSLSTLSDERSIEPRRVEALALEEPGVLEAHNVRSRGPHDDIHLDLHILVHPATPLAEAHAIGHRVESRLRNHWQGLSDVVVHVEPALESERARVREGGGLKAEG